VWDGGLGWWIAIGWPTCLQGKSLARQTICKSYFGLFVISTRASCRTLRVSCRMHNLQKKHKEVGKKGRNDGEEYRGCVIGFVECPLTPRGPSITCNAFEKAIFSFLFSLFFVF